MLTIHFIFTNYIKTENLLNLIIALIKLNKNEVLGKKNYYVLFIPTNQIILNFSQGVKLCMLKAVYPEDIHTNLATCKYKIS